GSTIAGPTSVSPGLARAADDDSRAVRAHPLLWRLHSAARDARSRRQWLPRRGGRAQSSGLSTLAVRFQPFPLTGKSCAEIHGRFLWLLPEQFTIGVECKPASTAGRASSGG